MEKLVTIVSVYYNREDYVTESINSLLFQTHQNLEIIIIDDGSTDKTYERLNEFNDSRLKIISHENMGFVKSIKKAISIAKSEIIAIHGSGDISHADRIEKQLKVLKENSEVGLVSNYANKVNKITGKSRVTDELFNSNKGYIEQLLGKDILIHGSTMFLKSVYNKVNGYRDYFKYGQDRDLWLRMCQISKPHVIPEVLYTMYVLPDSVSDNFNKRIMQLYFRSMSSQCINMRIRYGADIIDEYGTYAGFFRSYDKELSNKLFRTALTEISKGNTNNAFFSIELSTKEWFTFRNFLFKLLLKVSVKTKFSTDLLIKVMKNLKGNRI